MRYCCHDYATLTWQMARVNSLSVDLKGVRLSRWAWLYHINPLNLVQGSEIKSEIWSTRRFHGPLLASGWMGPRGEECERTPLTSWQQAKKKKGGGRGGEALESYNCKELNSANNENELGCEFFPSLQIRTQSEQYLAVREELLTHYELMNGYYFKLLNLLLFITQQ